MNLKRLAEEAFKINQLRLRETSEMKLRNDLMKIAFDAQCAGYKVRFEHNDQEVHMIIEEMYKSGKK